MRMASHRIDTFAVVIAASVQCVCTRDGCPIRIATDRCAGRRTNARARCMVDGREVAAALVFKLAIMSWSNVVQILMAVRMLRYC